MFHQNNKNIPASKYDNMHPDYIDYSLIDLPLRNLVKTINNNSWAKTIGSCGGRACHKGKGFYLIVEVKGISGIRNFLRWLSLSHALGFKARYESNLLRDYALPMAEIVAPNLLHSDNSNSGALMGKEWIRFHIRFYLGGKLINRAQTRGGIRALEIGWSAIKNKKIVNSKVNYRREL